jgi:hypothetical protein
MSARGGIRTHTPSRAIGFKPTASDRVPPPGHCKYGHVESHREPSAPTVKVVGRRLDPGDYRLRDFLTRAAQPHEFYLVERVEAAALAHHRLEELRKQS